MFDSVRNNKKIVQIILALIILPFAFWGVESYIGNMGGGKDVASVGDSKISLAEFQEALREQQDRLRPTLGGRDPALLESPELRRAVLDNLVQRRLLDLHAGGMKLAVSNEQLVGFIASVPQLQEDGKFSPQRYEQLIAAQGKSKSRFEYEVRHDMTIQQAIAAIGNASLAGRTTADRWLAAQLEEREVSDVVLRADAFVYYEANTKKFELPEQLRAEFVILSRDRLIEQTAVSDEEVKAWYAGHPERYKQPEERRASHVLIAVGAKASDDELKAAEAKADDVLAQAKKSPGDFARLAKQYSQDPGSAPKGGDLEWFGRGAMVKAFEDAAFSMKEGQVSDVVRSDFGLHVIKLTGIRAERSRPLEEVRAEIAAELKAATAAGKYAEIAEGFSNTVYEQPDSLAPAAEKYKLTIQKSDWLRKGAAAPGPLANDKLMAALFSDDAIKNKRNTEAVEVAPNVLVSARVLEYKPAAQQPLETVEPTIARFLAHQEAAKLAAQDGEQKLARLNKGEKVELGWSKPHAVTRGMAGELPPDVLRAIFTADTAKLPAYAGVPGAGGYVLFRISQVKPYAAEGGDPPQARAMRGEYARLVAEEEMAGWIASLRTKYPVEINQTVLDSKEER
ncbi:MAG: SurA N-terminal domain-containing protein [Rhodocyclales bacterium]|nr:SurA N-terminal domain-containing protein [Rhodocyclales bacterium]